jgi:hypothetical protein
VRKIEARADRDKEKSEQQTFKGLDRDFDLAAVLGFGEQNAGDEGAKSHRQTARRGENAGANHHKQAGRHEKFGRSRRRDVTK